MAEPVTVNVALIVPNTGDLSGLWGSQALNPDFVAIDGFLGGVQAIGATNSPITLTSPAGFTPVPSGGPTQSQNGVLRFTGALTGNVQVTLPLPGYTIIENLTTGAFVLSFRAIGSGQVIATSQGSCRHVYNDGTNVRFVNLPDVGSYLDLAVSSVPAWISACSIPPYLNCDGSTFSAATYPFLNALLGGNTLPDFRGSSPAYLNQGTSRITTGGSGINGDVILSSGGAQIVALSVSQLPTGIISSAAQTITVVAPGGENFIVGTGFTVANTGSGTNQVTNITNPIGNASGASGVNTITVVSSNTSGAAHQNMQPSTIAGLRLIRAA